VFPYRWKGESAQQYAQQIGAELAASRGQPGKFSLSPASMLHARPGTKIVLPSPNGSQLTAQAESVGGTVLAGCFRNARAVAHYAQGQRKPITVVACGERWPDDTLRPAVEDLAAAGAIIAQLSGTASPEARVAAAAWELAQHDLTAFLKSCTSGRE